MKAKLLLVAVIAITIAITGCKKTDEEQALEIHVHSPSANAAYTSPVAVDVHIEGGELIIHDIEIKIFEKADVNNIVFNYDNHVEVSSYEVSDNFSVGNLTGPTTFTLQANVGEGEHTTSLTHDFTIQP